MLPEAARGFLKQLFGGVLGVVMVLAFAAQPACLRVAPAETCQALNLKPEIILGYTAIVLNVALFLFNGWLWHTKLGRLIGWKTPDIRGTWLGELNLLEHLPGIHAPGTPIAIILVVRQEAFRVRLTLYTKESCSSSLAAEFTRIDADNELIYSYRNEPDLQHRNRSKIHIGTAVLKMMSVKPSTLSGVYYTDRLTAGQMELKEHAPELAVNFQDGLHLNFQIRPIIR